jgi:hypothetical protein
MMQWDGRLWVRVLGADNRLIVAPFLFLGLCGDANGGL